MEKFDDGLSAFWERKSRVRPGGKHLVKPYLCFINRPLDVRRIKCRSLNSGLSNSECRGIEARRVAIAWRSGPTALALGATIPCAAKKSRV
jgi:hypothetical protein